MSGTFISLMKVLKRRTRLLVQLSWAKPSKENGGGATVSVAPVRVPVYALAEREAQVSINCCGAACPDEKAGRMPRLPLCSVHRLAAGAGALFIIQFS